MSRQYQALWRRIANKEEVVIRCHHTNVKKLRKALQKEKYLHKRARKMTDLPSFGTLETEVLPIENDPYHVRMIFRLSYSGDNL